MASSLSLSRLVASNLLNKSLLRPLLRPVAGAPSLTVRSFNTNAQYRDYTSDDDIDDRGGLDRRSDRSLSRRRDDFLSEVLDPFSPTRSLSQVLNMMDQFMDRPIISAARGGGGGGSGAGIRRAWDARETDGALHLRIDMPGLGKENVKVSVEQSTLVIKGEGNKESDDEESGSRYTSRIDLPEKVYKIDQVKAEMKNGVLKVVVPKVKEEARTDVINVNVD